MEEKKSNQSPKEKKGFFSRLIEKLDKKMEEKARKSPCCLPQEKKDNKPCCN